MCYFVFSVNERVVVIKQSMALLYANELLVRADLPFKNLIYSRYLTSFGSCYSKKQIDISFLCVCPLIVDKFRHNIVKVCCGTTHLQLVVPQPL